MIKGRLLITPQFSAISPNQIEREHACVAPAFFSHPLDTVMSSANPIESLSQRDWGLSTGALEAERLAALIRERICIVRRP